MVESPTDTQQTGAKGRVGLLTHRPKFGAAAQAFSFLGCIFVLTILALSSEMIGVTSRPSMAPLLGRGLLVILSGTLAGVVLGFLFGLPRTKQSIRPNARRGVEYQVNTNLEQVSDWLTKILIGIGLANLAKMGPAIKALSEFLGTVLGSPQNGAFGVMLLTAGVLCGFLTAFTWTRISYAEMLKKADGYTIEEKIEHSTRLAAKLSVAANALATGKRAMLENALTMLRKEQEFLYLRGVAIFLGRLFRAVGNEPAAVRVLTNSLLQRRKRGDEEDEDDADILFNKACYEYQMWKRADDQVKGPLLEEVQRSLRESCRINAENVSLAKMDPDLNGLDLGFLYDPTNFLSSDFYSAPH